VLVAGDFVTTGGMDAANHALAAGLARRGREVHLVAHRGAPDLDVPAIRLHAVPRPLGSHLLGFPLLARAAGATARRLSERNPIVVANGGNCRVGTVCWLHYVHAAYAPETASGPRRALGGLARRRFVADERAAARRARAVVCNSALTARHAVALLGADPARVHVVHYGGDPRFAPPTAAERAAAREALGWGSEPVALFVGALGDRRKGFDTLFAAWAELCRDAGWDARLAVAGTGAELDAWRAKAAAAGMGDRISFLGFRDDVPRLLRAADLLVSPTRYEAYGLAVREALCCAVPALVSARAGVAEEVPAELGEMLIADPDDAVALAASLRRWRDAGDAWAPRLAALSVRLRAWTWDDMAASVLDIGEAAG
jgi:glycosyltransferase involved in cell wall biosynthesis